MRIPFRSLLVLLAAGALALSLEGVAQQKAPQAAPQSLRGNVAVEETSNAEVFQQARDHGPIPRDYVQQPPLVPHKVDGYRIDRNFNKCMDCHAWSKAKAAGATKVSLTHFRDRSTGAEMANISPARYFCTQCHVPQMDAKPLVGNSFRPVEALAQPKGK